MPYSSIKDADVPQQHPLVPHCVYGHVLAGASLILMGYFVAYMLRFESLIGGWTLPAVLTVVVMVMVMVLVTVRKDEGGIRFVRAFGLALLSGMGARLGYTVFMLLLFHVMRPDLVEVFLELVLDQSFEMMSNLGLPAPLEDLEESLRFSLSVRGLLLDALMSGFWIALVAVIVAAFMRRHPETDGGFHG